MPPVQETLHTIVVHNQAPNCLTRPPAFPKYVPGAPVNNESNIYDENDNESSKIPSTAEQCKEIIDRSKQSVPVFINNNSSNTNFNNLLNDKGNDDDCWNLTSLEWLQDRNLLRRVITNPDSGRAGFFSTSPTPSEESRIGRCNSSCKFIIPKSEYPTDPDGFEPLMPSAYHPTRHADCKPPYSFSCLIFMAIENSPDKRLPVKDIYAWIQNNFPFFSRAPSGWKNSVRHNLSLNKCFTKVEKDRGVGIGKGSYWCVDPTYKANLLHALRKTPYQPFHQMQMVSSNHYASSVGTPMTMESNVIPNSNIKSLFPYTSKKPQGRQVADSSEIDVANALVSLRRSGVQLNDRPFNDEEDCDNDDEYEGIGDEDEEEWLDEDVDDEEADDDDDEEIATTQLFHMLKRKLGQQKIRKDLCCTPAATSDHQYGMTDDRVRDILTRFDCFDDCCSVGSSMSDDDEDVNEDEVRRIGRRLEKSQENFISNGAGRNGNKNTSNIEEVSVEFASEIEIKEEIKEEQISDTDGKIIETASRAMSSATVRPAKKLKLMNKKVLRSGFANIKMTGFSAIQKANAKTSMVTRTMSGTRRKRKFSSEDNDKNSEEGGNFRDGEPRLKRVDIDEEEQRVREGADALLELATIMAANRQSATTDTTSTSKGKSKKGPNDRMVNNSSPAEHTVKRPGRRGRPPINKNMKTKFTVAGNTSTDETAGERDFETSHSFSRRSNSDISGKKRLPKDFVPNGLTSVGSAPRSFQSKRLQMRYLEQIVLSHEVQSFEGPKTSRQCKSSRGKTSRSSKPQVAEESSSDSDREVDSEEAENKDWTLNFSSIDLSEVNTYDFGQGEVLYDQEGNKMVIIGQVKEEPLDEAEVKEEVADNYE